MYVDLSYVVPVKSKVKISQNFVAFSEYLNFTIHFATFDLKIVIFFLSVSSKRLRAKIWPREPKIFKIQKIQNLKLG